MESGPKSKPIVLCFSGFDPSGGAGIQADIETLAATGCLATPVITCLTVQNSQNVDQLIPVDPQVIRDQLTSLATDYQYSAIKIGLLGSPVNLEIIIEFIHQHPHIPVILDPILAAGGGKALSSDRLVTMITEKLLPHCTLITPNSDEARTLTGEKELKGSAAQLLKSGCEFVMITGTHEETDTVTNTLYPGQSSPISTEWPRLPNSYHGSGCTFASACAGYLALGDETPTAVEKAQHFTWNALRHGWRPGQGQHIPDRVRY